MKDAMHIMYFSFQLSASFQNRRAGAGAFDNIPQNYQLLVHSVFRIVLEAVTQSIQFQENIPPYLPSCGCLPVDPATKRPKLIHHCCVQPSQKASPNFINLRVSLPSGRCELVSLPLNDAVDDLKIAKKNVSSYVSWCLPHQTDTF